MNYLSPTYFFDYENEHIQNLLQEFQSNSLSQKEKTIQVYLKIRDDWRYNAYQINFNKEAFRASEISQRSEGHCIDKAILLTTCLRGLGIPARVHFAKVKNHIAVETLTEKLGTNELTPHGMVDVFLEGKWVKSSPAFNASLCEKCNVAPLDFDGESDSVFQEYNRDGNEFMEYVEDYGHFEDLPYDFILQNMNEHYGQFFNRKEGQERLDIS
ncbi:MAG: transglutaminase family protein [Saprospiraceae bacterium]